MNTSTPTHVHIRMQQALVVHPLTSHNNSHVRAGSLFPRVHHRAWFGQGMGCHTSTPKGHALGTITAMRQAATMAPFGCRPSCCLRCMFVSTPEKKKAMGTTASEAGGERRRHLIVTYGPAAGEQSPWCSPPAGSGKGHIREEYEAQLRHLYPTFTPTAFERFHRLIDRDSIRPLWDAMENRMYVAEIDNYVESDEVYNQEARRITRQYLRDCGAQSAADIGACLKKGPTTTALATELSGLYFQTRGKYAAEVMDVDLAIAMNNGLHIVLETTGANDLEWLWQQVVDRQNGAAGFRYTITLVFPVVLQKTIMERIYDRFVRRATCILEAIPGQDEHCVAPRLPDVQQVPQAIQGAYLRLQNYVADPRVHHVFVYDNNVGCRRLERTGKCLRFDRLCFSGSLFCDEVSHFVFCNFENRGC